MRINCTVTSVAFGTKHQLRHPGNLTQGMILLPYCNDINTIKDTGTRTIQPKTTFNSEETLFYFNNLKPCKTVISRGREHKRKKEKRK